MSILTLNTTLVYKATSPSGKSYVGITSTSLRSRQLTHKRDALRYNKKFTFHSAIRKYGWHNIKWEILEKVDSWELAQKREIFFISELDTYRNGYNMTLGGDGHRGFKQSEETKLKRANKIRGKLLGKKLSPEHVEALRKCQMGNTNNLGTKLSDEQKKNISDNQKHRMKAVICIETGQEFESICLTAKVMGLDKTNIQKCLNKRINKTCGGYSFKFKEIK